MSSNDHGFSRNSCKIQLAKILIEMFAEMQNGLLYSLTFFIWTWNQYYMHINLLQRAVFCGGFFCNFSCFLFIVLIFSKYHIFQSPFWFCWISLGHWILSSSFLLIVLGLCCSFFWCLRECLALVFSLSHFLINVFKAISFPVSSTFCVSYKLTV